MSKKLSLKENLKLIRRGSRRGWASTERTVIEGAVSKEGLPESHLQMSIIYEGDVADLLQFSRSGVSGYRP